MKEKNRLKQVFDFEKEWAKLLLQILQIINSLQQILKPINFDSISNEKSANYSSSFSHICVCTMAFLRI